MEAVNSGKITTMTSLEIAKLTDKRHADVCRDIRSMIEELEKERLKRMDEWSPEYDRGKRKQYKYLKPSTLDQVLNKFDGAELHHEYEWITSEKDNRGYGIYTHNMI